MAMLHDDGPQDTAEKASGTQRGFLLLEVAPRSAGFDRVDFV